MKVLLCWNEKNLMRE